MGKLTKGGEGNPLQRLPLNSLKDAKRLLARLTRLMVKGELDIGQYRAAVYGISTFVNAVKAEMPATLLHGNISIGPPHGANIIDDAANMAPADREAYLHKIITQAGYIKADKPPALECVRTVGTISGEPLQVVLPEWIAQGQAMQAACDALSTGQAEAKHEPIEATEKDSADAWHSCGIGAKRNA